MQADSVHHCLKLASIAVTILSDSATTCLIMPMRSNTLTKSSFAWLPVVTDLGNWTPTVITALHPEADCKYDFVSKVKMPVSSLRGAHKLTSNARTEISDHDNPFTPEELKQWMDPKVLVCNIKFTEQQNRQCVLAKCAMPLQSKRHGKCCALFEIMLS